MLEPLAAVPVLVPVPVPELDAEPDVAVIWTVVAGPLVPATDDGRPVAGTERVVEGTAVAEPELEVVMTVSLVATGPVPEMVREPEDKGALPDVV